MLTENDELIKEQVKYTWQKYINIFLEKRKKFSFLAEFVPHTQIRVSHSFRWPVPRVCCFRIPNACVRVCARVSLGCIDYLK